MGLAADFNFMVLVAADVGSIGLTALIAHRMARGWGNRFAAVAASWLMATSPVMVDVSVEARGYAMLAMLGVAGVLLTVRVLEAGRGRDFVLLVLVESAALYTHNAWVIMLAAFHSMALLPMGRAGRRTICGLRGAGWRPRRWWPRLAACSVPLSGG